MTTKLTAAELEVLFTTNVDQEMARTEKVIKSSGDKIDKKPIKQKVDADTKEAVEAMERVEKAAKRVVTAKTVATIDANIERAEKQFTRVNERLDYLKAVSPNLAVDADVKRAQTQLDRVTRQLDALRKTKTEIEVDANTKPLEDAADRGGASFFRKLDGATRGAGEKVGSTVGAGVEESLISALTAIPVAGGIVLAGVAIGKAVVGGIQDGLAVEVRQDRLQALAGLDEADARRIGFGAGEAYANTFGESIESNMSTARLGLQFGILDEEATTRDAQKVIEGLAGISDVLEEDVRPVATTVATLLKTGLASSAEDAFDLLATAQREGVNRADDLLDTFTEYPVVLRRLGLSGQESLGLMNQALDAGARNSDVAADALKEFQIRATDSSKLSAAGFERLGLNAEDMTAKIARGGQDARDGLDEVLRKLRETEDPVQRNAAAVELFGTKAEDLGDALFAMDLSTAVEQLDGVTGSAQRMFDTLASNDATKLEQAKRNIDVGIQGIQGALAAGFSEPLGEAAEWVSQNRGPVLQFFLDMANGALDFAASATEGVGAFVAGPLADMVDGIGTAIDFLNGAFEGRPPELDELVAGMRDIESSTDDVVDVIGQAKDRLNEMAEPAVALGYVSDAAQRTASAVADLGSETGTLDSQLRAAVEAMYNETAAAQEAGESQQNLTDRYNATTGALVDQLVQMGYTREDAEKLIATYGAVPTMVTTEFDARTGEAEARIARLQGVVANLKDRTIRVNVTTANGSPVSDQQLAAQFGIGGYSGGVLEFMAQGGLRGPMHTLTPMSPLAQMVPANTWRVVGDRSDVPELFAPLDGSARSWALLAEGMRRMPGVMPMADGAIAAPAAASAPGVSVGDVTAHFDLSPSEAELRRLILGVLREWADTTFARGGA